MTNSFNKMAGKNSAERNGTPGRPRSTSKLRPLKAVNVNANVKASSYINSLATPPRVTNNVAVAVAVAEPPKQRLTPSPASGIAPSPRTSPGLIAGYFAGGKWSEPPSPATLPKPPQHWTQLMFANKCSAIATGKPQQTDIASQLKVLLNVQA